MKSYDNFVKIESLSKKSILNLESAYWNRKLDNHGFSTCAICQSKLMAYLEKGHGFDDVVKILKEKHPTIKNIRAYARNAVRVTTGVGIYDDYIIEHNLWTVRNPILAPPDIRKMLKKIWKELAENGRRLIEMDNKFLQTVKKDDETSELLKYVIGRVKS